MTESWFAHLLKKRTVRYTLKYMDFFHKAFSYALIVIVLVIIYIVGTKNTESKKILTLLLIAGGIQSLSVVGTGLFGIIPYLVFALVTIPITCFALKSAFKDIVINPTKKISTSRWIAPVSTALVVCAVSWGAVFITHFGVRYPGVSGTLTTLFAGTLVSFTLLYGLTYHFIPWYLFGKSLFTKPGFSGYSMWLGYFLILNLGQFHGLDIQLPFRYELAFNGVEHTYLIQGKIPESLATLMYLISQYTPLNVDQLNGFMNNCIHIFSGFVNEVNFFLSSLMNVLLFLSIMVTPIFYLQEIRKELEQENSSILEEKKWLALIRFVVAILVVYVVYNWLINFNYSLSCC